LDILTTRNSYVSEPLKTALDHYRVIREILPPNRVIDLGERPVSEAGLFVGRALELGLASATDLGSGRPISELKLCQYGDFYPCNGKRGIMCGCVSQDYCLPDGRLLSTMPGICT
jgi:hypothetical protein